MPRSPEDGGRPAANDIHTTYMTYITYTEGGVLPALGRHIAPLANTLRKVCPTVSGEPSEAVA